MKQLIARYIKGSKANQANTFSNENILTNEATTLATKLIKTLALTLSLCTYGCSAAQYGEQTVTIMDRGLGVPAQIYTVIPDGYQISGYKTTDPSKGITGDGFVLIAGPDGKRRIFGASVMMANGDINLLLRYVTQSIQTALQRAGESGNLTSGWKQAPSLIASMNNLQAEFATPDGRVGQINLFYLMDGGSGTAFPMITFSHPQDINQFIRELQAIDNGVQNNPQWSVRQQQAAQNGIRQLNSNHQSRMASMQSQFDAGQRAHAARQAGYDRANAQWRENFNSDWSTQSPDSSGGGQAAFIDMITETERYQDPSTGYERRLDAGYDHTYTNGQGNYYQTNDHFFEPGSMQGDWGEAEMSGW